MKIWFCSLLVILAIGAIFSLTRFGATVMLISMISIVGIPIGIALMMLPSIFLWAAISGLVYQFLPTGMRFRKTAAALASVTILATIPIFLNMPLRHGASSLVAEDRNGVTGSRPIRSLAVVQPRSYRDPGVCDDLCQRALLNGAVDQFLSFDINEGQSALDASLSGTRYRFEQNADCRHIGFASGLSNLEIPSEGRRTDRKTPAELLQVEGVKGRCVTATKAMLSDADTVIHINPVKHGKTESQAGFDLFADTVSATRLSLYERHGKDLVEIYRSTGVTYQPLAPLLLPMQLGDLMGSPKPGFFRTQAHVGDAARFRPAPKIETLLFDVLKLDLALKDTNSDSDIRTLVRQALDNPGQEQDKHQTIINVFFETISRDAGIAREDARLVTALTGNENLPLGLRSEMVIAKIKGEAADMIPEIGAALFSRLKGLLSRPWASLSREEGQQFYIVAGAISSLPDTAILPHLTVLELLAQNKEARVVGYQALTKLSAFGDSAVPTLIYLIDDAERFSLPQGGSLSDWQHPYLAGMIGLCLSGDKAASAIPLLEARVASGRLKSFGPYKRLTEKTLASLRRSEVGSRHYCSF